MKSRLQTALPTNKTSKLGRRKILRKLSHDTFIHTSDQLHFESVAKLSASEIADKLRSLGSQNLGYAISQDDDWDANYWYLNTILEMCVGWGCGISLSCIPGKLLYVEREDKNFRYIVTSG